jgi:3-methyladenine DNA glycosylase AlkD
VPVEAVLAELHALGSEANRIGMARYGINTSRALGVPVAELRRMARRLGRDHALALDLWASEVHEARILASIVDRPSAATEPQLEAWAADFDSWDLCDQCCANLFRRTPFARAKATLWPGRDQTFVKRAGFSLIAGLAREPSLTPDEVAAFLALIEREAGDDRNFVKKAVNWALREIGKRDPPSRALALATAERLRASRDRSARWIAADALRELTPERAARNGTPSPGAGAP